MGATALSFGLCFAYLVFLPFHPWALAGLVGLGTLLLTVIGRPGCAPVAGITTAVVMVAAGLSPRDAWQQPLLRAVDTAVGIAIGLAASWLATPRSSTVLGSRPPEADEVTATTDQLVPTRVETLGALPPQDELLEDTIQIVDQSLNTFAN